MAMMKTLCTNGDALASERGVDDAYHFQASHDVPRPFVLRFARKALQALPFILHLRLDVAPLFL